MILKFLLDNLEDPDDVNVTDNINATPAHDAAEYGKIKTMLLLLKHKADISITDTVRSTNLVLGVSWVLWVLAEVAGEVGAPTMDCHLPPDSSQSGRWELPPSVTYGTSLQPKWHSGSKSSV